MRKKDRSDPQARKVARGLDRARMTPDMARLWDREFKEKTVADSLADYRRRRAEEKARQDEDRQRKFDF